MFFGVFFIFCQIFSFINQACPLERSVRFCAQKIVFLLEITLLNFFKIGHFWLIFSINSCNINNLFDQFLKKFVSDCRIKVVFRGVFWSFFHFLSNIFFHKSSVSLGTVSKILCPKNCIFVRDYASKFFQNWPFLAYFFYK